MSEPRILDWIDTQTAKMETRLRAWVGMNTGTHNPLGLEELASILQAELAPFADNVRRIPGQPYEELAADGRFEHHQLGPHLHAVRRPAAPRQVLLAIHMDTVYGPQSSFQTWTQLNPSTLQGPGVADAKGGLVVLFTALQAFEEIATPEQKQQLGWEVIINSDEEIGSPTSAPLFAEAAGRVDCGLLFEPCLPDGALVSTRKGSGNFSIQVEGQSAHSGRDFFLGRNAIVAAAEISIELHRLNGRWPDLTLNVARIDGGGPSNMVPGLAIIRFNVRYPHPSQEALVLGEVDEILARVQEKTGCGCRRVGAFLSPPKVESAALRQMLDQIRDCGTALGLDLHWTPSGGACDGNRLAIHGVPNVDTLGVRGGKIHSQQEYVLLESLAERAKLTALYLLRLATGELDVPARIPVTPEDSQPAGKFSP